MHGFDKYSTSSRGRFKRLLHSESIGLLNRTIGFARSPIGNVSADARGGQIVRAFNELHVMGGRRDNTDLPSVTILSTE
jgi:hypothetical protein